MKILCLNPNRTAFVTATVAAEMRAVLGPDVEVIEATAEFGPDVIRTHLDEAVACHAAVDMVARQGTGVDAILVAASYDPALEAIRQLVDVPVLGISGAAIAMARMMARRIGYVSAGALATPLYRDRLARYDMAVDMAAWQVIETPAAFAAGDKTAVEAQVLDSVQDLAAAGAEVAVLLGGVYAGFARKLGPASPIPLMDGGLAGALMLQALQRTGPLSQPRSFAPSRFEGVSPALQQLAAAPGA